MDKATVDNVDKAGTFNAGDVVAAFVDARKLASVLTTREQRAIIGKYAKALIKTGWSREVMLAAVAEFAAGRRHPRFLEEWVRETYWKWEDAEHAIRKAEARLPMAPEVAAAIGKPLHRLPSRATEPADGPPTLGWRQKCRHPECPRTALYKSPGCAEHERELTTSDDATTVQRTTEGGPHAS